MAILDKKLLLSDLEDRLNNTGECLTSLINGKQKTVIGSMLVCDEGMTMIFLKVFLFLICGLLSVVLALALLYAIILLVEYIKDSLDDWGDHDGKG